MQITANTSLVFTDRSSFKRLADLQGQIGHGGFYQHVTTELMRGVLTKQFRDVGDKLIVLAEHAHAVRQMDMLEQVSQILSSLGLPRRYEAIAQYYQALCIHKFGHGNHEEAVRLLDSVASHAPIWYRLRAIQSLAGNFCRKGDYQIALSGYKEAQRFAMLNGLYDPYSIVGTRKMIAAINGVDGNHRGALALLESLFPLAHHIRSSQPHVYYDYMNSLAVELGEVGRLEEAENVSRIVLASPYAGAYPEWRDTRDEIQLRGRRASRSTVAFSQITSEVKNPPRSGSTRAASDSAATKADSRDENLVRLPVPERAESFPQSTATSGSARVLSIQEWKESMPKQSTLDPQQKTIPKATTDRQKQDRLNELRNLGTRELLMGLMDAFADENISDDQLVRALIVLEDLEPDANHSA